MFLPLRILREINVCLGNIAKSQTFEEYIKTIETAISNGVGMDELDEMTANLNDLFEEKKKKIMEGFKEMSDEDKDKAMMKSSAQMEKMTKIKMKIYRYKKGA